MSKTLDYYNENAEAFNSHTRDVDFAKTQDEFLKYLQPKAYILDFGCGSGRDTRAFLQKGYQVDAIDGSDRLCKLASEYTGVKVKKMFFQELSAKDQYDGIWACSSILHLTYDDLENVFRKMADALKENGIVYTSFKYGKFEGERNGRYFLDMDEEKLKELLDKINCYEVKEQWITGDVRAGREDERWLNVIMEKE